MTSVDTHLRRVSLAHREKLGFVKKDWEGELYDMGRHRVRIQGVMYT